MKISSFFKPLSFLPALALMYMIYSFSSQPADSSSSTSFYISRKVVQVVDLVAQKNWDDWEIDQHAARIHGIVRKAAHVTEFFLLAVAVSFPLYVYGVRGILLMILAGVICVGYACGDEYHQSLVDGRAASSRDVLIDSVGVLFGIILTRLIGWSGRMAITGPIYERRQKQQQRELDAREEELSRREEALRREEMRYRKERSSGRRRDGFRQAGYSQVPPDPRQARTGYPQSPSGTRQDQPRYPQSPSGTRQDQPDPSFETKNRPRIPENRHKADDRTQVIGTSHEVDNRTRGAGSSHVVDDRTRGAGSGQEVDDRTRGAGSGYGVDDRTRVIGTSHEIDDRTRVYRSEEEKRRMEEAYRRQAYELRQVQSKELQEDSTSDQLSEDLPFSRLFRKKE